MKKYLLSFLITLITPCFAQTTYDIVASNPAFSIFFTAIQDAGLGYALNTANTTVFLPTNDAFTRLPAETLAGINKDRRFLAELLKMHIVPGTYDTLSFLSHPVLPTLGKSITMAVGSGLVYAENAKVITPDVKTSNGIVHVIDALILPPNPGLQEGALQYLLDGKNRSGVLGIVTLTGNEEQTIVTVSLTGTQGKAFHPAKIHYGNCGSGGEVMAGLNDVVASYGISRTVLKLALSSFANTDAYVNIQVSPENPNQDVACGEIGLGVIGN